MTDALTAQLAYGTPVRIVDHPKHMWDRTAGWTGTFVTPHQLPDTSVLSIRGALMIVHNDDFEVTGTAVKADEEGE
jgi:hypothetical protein